MYSLSVVHGEFPSAFTLSERPQHCCSVPSRRRLNPERHGGAFDGDVMVRQDGLPSFVSPFLYTNTAIVFMYCLWPYTLFIARITPAGSMQLLDSIICWNAIVSREQVLLMNFTGDTCEGKM